MEPKNNINTKNNKVLFDTSALLALIHKEPGYERLEGLLASSCISAVNFSEVIIALTKIGVPQNEIQEVVSVIPEILPFTQDIGLIAGNLFQTTQELGLSLGNSACIATAMQNNMIVYTTDKAWAKLNIESLDIVVIC